MTHGDSLMPALPPGPPLLPGCYDHSPLILTRLFKVMVDSVMPTAVQTGYATLCPRGFFFHTKNVKGVQRWVLGPQQDVQEGDTLGMFMSAREASWA